jgi:hypothetical protein
MSLGTIPDRAQAPARPSHRMVFYAAALTVVLHALGLALAVFGMREGTPLVGLAERMAHLAKAPLGWSVGWAVWMLCALSLVVFFHALAERAQRASLARLCLSLVAVGAAVDLLCDTLFLVVLPEVAAAGSTSVFLAVERAAGAAGTIVANGLYAVAVLMMSYALGRRRVVLLGWAVFACGVGMAVSGVTGVPEHLEIATGPTFAALCAWALLAAPSRGQ